MPLKSPRYFLSNVLEIVGVWREVQSNRTVGRYYEWTVGVKRNTNCEIIKILEENIGSKFSDISWSNILDDMFPRAKEVKDKINK